MSTHAEPPESPYDKHTAFYLNFVDTGLADPQSLANTLAHTVLELIGDRAAGADILDVACGEGYLSRRLLRLEPRSLVGIDLSLNLIEEAKRRSAGSAASFHCDDAQTLATVANESIDVAVSQMALMDIADLQATFHALDRVMRRHAIFVFSMLHPCFETPFLLPGAPPHLLDETGERVAVVTRRYATEGYWQSGGSGVRGHMGAHHRSLATILNGLIRAGFAIAEIREPLPGGKRLGAEIPFALVIRAEKSS